MPRGPRRVLAWLVVLSALAVSSSAWAAAPGRGSDAETRTAARQLAKQAIELMAQDRWHEAQDLLHRAYALVPAPTIATLEGMALERMGRLVEAADRYEQARITPAHANRPAAFVEAAAHAEERLRALQPRIPRLSVVVNGVEPDDDDLEVSIDGRAISNALLGAAVAQPVNPGRHVVTASYDGATVATEEITLREMEKRSVVLDMSGRPRRSSLGRTLGWTSLGIGAAGILTGAVAGAVMLGEQSTLDARCQPTCPEDARDEHSAFRTARTVSFVGWGVGIGGLALGATLLLSSSGSETPSEAAPGPAPRAARVAAVIGPTSLAVVGEF